MWMDCVCEAGRRKGEEEWGIMAQRARARAKGACECVVCRSTRARQRLRTAYPAAARPLDTTASVMPWYSASEMHEVLALLVQSSVGVASRQRKI